MRKRIRQFITMRALRRLERLGLIDVIISDEGVGYRVRGRND